VYLGYRGHAFFAVAPLSRTKILCANSWSPEWNGDGFFEVDTSRIYTAYGMYATQTVREPKAAVLSEVLEKQAAVKEFADLNTAG